jgi:hypothetical protein
MEPEPCSGEREILDGAARTTLQGRTTVVDTHLGLWLLQRFPLILLWIVEHEECLSVVYFGCGMVWCGSVSLLRPDGLL